MSRSSRASPCSLSDRFLLSTTSISRDVGEFLIAEALAQSNPVATLHELVPDLDFLCIECPAEGAVASKTRAGKKG